jgi:outer membrane protein assembly factor BamB
MMDASTGDTSAARLTCRLGVRKVLPMSHNRSNRREVSRHRIPGLPCGGVVRRWRERFALGLMGALFLGAWAAMAEWPEFRGPTGDGHAPVDGRTVPLNWSETENVSWKTAIPHRGWSAPVVLEGKVWVTTATVDGHEAFVLGLDAATGEVLFHTKVFHVEQPEPLGNGASMNCYATPSAVIEPGRIYVHFGSAGTACLDTATGEVLWKRNDLPCRHYRGPSSSLVSFKNLLILTMDGADLQYHVALDKASGETVWRTNRSVAWNDEDVPGQMARDGDLRKAHSTPLIVRVDGEAQMISAGAKAAYGYDPGSGRELWRVEYPDWSVAPRPVFDGRLAYIVTGLSKKEMWAVNPRGRGDVTETGVLWKLRTHVGRYASPLLVDGLLYLAAEESFVSCVEAATGRVLWTERIGGRYAASPVYAGGRLYFFNQEGETIVLKPGRTFERLATNVLDDGFMASPAVSGGAFFLRTRSHLYRVETASAEESKKSG